ncbi:hypothetical protein [Bartonella heixiaziensis]|uniref:hypothetical protein n=1 Tax=Bartonella heixiaziensis TaxID=1461000 RepID=UPI003D1DA9DC
MNDEEFVSAMYGSNDKTSIQGKQAPTLKHSGGHVDTANRRMISHIGCEDGCGYLCQFLSGAFAMQIQSSSTLWSSFKTEINVLVGGGTWQDDTNSGPFFRNGLYSRTSSDEKLGARGCSQPRRFV